MVATDPGYDGIVCAGDLVGVFPWMIAVTSWSHISCSLLVPSLSSLKRGPDIGEMWELGDCVFCKGTCGEPILDNRPVWVAGVCVSPVACGVMDSVLAARLVAGVAESPVGGWAEPVLLGCGDVCWSISG